MALRWGIVSAGKISHDFVNALNSYPAAEGQKVAGVAARDPARARAFAKLHNIPHAFETYETMAASKEIDVAYIGALNPDHHRLAKLFIESGKHVLCEKPLCLNYKQAKSLTDLARQKKVFLMEAVWSRCLPAYRALEEEIASGKLGDVLYAEANFGVPVGGVDRVWKKEQGGSALLDLGVYLLQFAQLVFKDEPVKVTARSELNAEGVDLVDTVILEYSGGRRAVLTAHAGLRLRNDATVVGTRGRTTLPDPFHAPTELVRADGAVDKFPLHASTLPYNFSNSAGLVYEALEVNRCIKQGLLESPRMPHKESLLIAKLEDTVRAQAGVRFDADDQEF